MAFQVLAGRVKVLFNSDAREFTAGQRQARREAARTRREMQRLRRTLVDGANAATRYARRLTLVVAPITALAGGAGLARVISRTAEWARTLQDLTVRTNASAVALQGYEQLLQGTRFELRDIGNVFATLAERIVEFQRGGTTAIEGFADIGVAAADLRGGLLGTEQALALVIQRYAELASQNPTRALAGLQALLGDDAELIQNLVSRFGGNVQAAQREALRQIGGGLTNEQVEQLAEVNATLLRIRSAISAGLDRVIAGNRREILRLAGRIEDSLPNIEGDLTEALRGILNSLLQNFERIRATLDGVLKWLTTDLVQFLQDVINILRATLILAIVGTLVQLGRLIFDFGSLILKFITGLTDISGNRGIGRPEFGRPDIDARTQSQIRSDTISGITRLLFLGVIGAFLFQFREQIAFVVRVLGEAATSVSNIFGRLTQRIEDSLEGSNIEDAVARSILDILGIAEDPVRDASRELQRFSSSVRSAATDLTQRFREGATDLSFEGQVASLTDMEAERTRFIASALESLDQAEDMLNDNIMGLTNSIDALREEITKLSENLAATTTNVPAVQPRIPPVIDPEFVGPFPDTRPPESSGRDFFRNIFRGIGDVFRELFGISAASAQESSVPQPRLITGQEQLRVLEKIQGLLARVLSEEIQTFQNRDDLTGLSRLRQIVAREISPDPNIAGETELDAAITEFDRQLQEKYRLIEISRRLQLDFDNRGGLRDFGASVDEFFTGLEQELDDRAREVTLSTVGIGVAFAENQTIALTRLIEQQRDALMNTVQEARIARDFAVEASQLNLPGSGQQVIETAEALEFAERALDAFNQSVSEGIPLWDTFIERLAARAEIQGLADRFRQLGDTIESSLGNAIERVIIDGQSLTDSFKIFVQEIITEILRIAVIRPLAQAIGGAISAGFGSAFGAPGFANGGLAGRGFAVVGEVGPELVDFSQPGRIYSNEQLGRALQGGRGGGIGALTMNIQSSDGPGVRAAINESLPAIVAASTGEVYQAANDRNSDFAQTIRNRASE